MNWKYSNLDLKYLWKDYCSKPNYVSKSIIGPDNQSVLGILLTRKLTTNRDFLEEYFDDFHSSIEAMTQNAQTNKDLK